jgi:hypothetical protein
MLFAAACSGDAEPAASSDNSATTTASVVEAAPDTQQYETQIVEILSTEVDYQLDRNPRYMLSAATIRLEDGSQARATVDAGLSTSDHEKLAPEANAGQLTAPLMVRAEKRETGWVITGVVESPRE